MDYLHLTRLNHIVAEHPVHNENSEYVKSKHLVVPERGFDEAKMNYTQSDVELKMPAQYRQDVREAKEHQRRYKEWREQFQDVNKAHRKAKMAYK